MARWRRKMMPLSDWAPFQDRFGDLQMASRGNPELALFADGEPGDELTAIYMTGPGTEVLERLSPGGWEDADPPSGNNVALLVGTADSWERFGINRP